MILDAAPNSRDAEEAVIGSVFIAPEILPLIRGIVSPQDFYVHRLGWVFEAFCELEKQAIDLVTVAEEMERKGRLEEAGGRAFLTRLVGNVPSSMNAELYAHIVHKHYIRRKLLSAASTVASRAVDEAAEIEDVVSDSIEAVQSAANGLLGGRAQYADKAVAEYVTNVFENAGKEMPGIASGFYDLDHLLGGGFQNDNLVIVAARPGVGKSAFLETVARYASKKHWVGLFSLEMSYAEQTGRLLAQETGIDTMRLRASKLTDEEWPLVDGAASRLVNLKLWIDDTAPLSFVTLRAKAVQKKSQGQLDLLMVDYAGLMTGIGNSPYERATYLSNNLKALSRELGVPLIAAQQLSRKVEAREENEPTLFDLRDSGSWEQDADIVIFIWNPGIDVPNVPHVPLKLRVAKHRNGPIGMTNVFREVKTTKFLNAERTYRDYTDGGE